MCVRQMSLRMSSLIDTDLTQYSINAGVPYVPCVIVVRDMFKIDNKLMLVMVEIVFLQK